MTLPVPLLVLAVIIVVILGILLYMLIQETDQMHHEIMMKDSRITGLNEDLQKAKQALAEERMTNGSR
jgi:predicted Holliday junction resolvase-like endonuclease